MSGRTACCTTASRNCFQVTLSCGKGYAALLSSCQQISAQLYTSL